MTLNQFIIHLMKNNKMIRIIGEQIGFMGLEMILNQFISINLMKNKSKMIRIIGEQIGFLGLEIILAIYQSLLNTVSKKFFKIKKFKKKYKN